jgi:hypothetical protein
MCLTHHTQPRTYVTHFLSHLCAEICSKNVSSVGHVLFCLLVRILNCIMSLMCRSSSCSRDFVFLMSLGPLPNLSLRTRASPPMNDHSLRRFRIGRRDELVMSRGHECCARQTAWVPTFWRRPLEQKNPALNCQIIRQVIPL